MIGSYSWLNGTQYSLWFTCDWCGWRSGDHVFPATMVDEAGPIDPKAEVHKRVGAEFTWHPPLVTYAKQAICANCAANRSDEHMARNGSANGKGKAEQETEQLVKVEKFEQELKVVLTTAEVAERADRAAHLVATKSELENQAKEQAQHAKAEIAKVALEIGQLSNAVRTKAEYKDVQCERRYIFRTGEVLEVRTDTGEELSRRPMYESEKQLELKLLEEQKAKEPSDTERPPAPEDESLPTEKRKRGRKAKAVEQEVAP